MSELIHQFGIDWRLLIAQAVNFGILFFVLYRYAYRPILSTLEGRRKKIEEGVRMSEEAKRRLDAAQTEREALLKKTEQESITAIQNAEALGKNQSEKIIQEGQRKQEEIIQEGKKRAEEERRTLRELFAKEAEELVAHAIAKFANTSPSAIDSHLVKQAITEAEHISKKVISA